jgi:glyoxylase-like metal-dependent hydrolase (beta-lactamase superfamily II)
MARERQAADHPIGFLPTQRYRRAMWSDVAQWRMYEDVGEPWFGFQAVRDLDGLPPEILLVPLPGHTMGHAGVAIQSNGGWLLNAGDSFMHHGQIDSAHPRCPIGLQIYQAIMSTDRDARLANIERLRELKRDCGSKIQIFAAHDSAQLAAMRGGLVLSD